MILEVVHQTGEFRKRAETPQELDRLRREAQVLEVARHPGVVQMLGLEGATLRLRLVDGPPLSDLVPDASATARIARAVATTLADLHDIGVVHGAVDATHIVVDPSGEAVLCGFGRGTVGMSDLPGARGDVAALANALLASGSPDDGTARVLRSAADDRARDANLDARRLARRLAHPASPGRRRMPAPNRPWRRWSGGRVAVCLSVALAVSVGAVASRWGEGHSAVACPAADQGCGPVATPGGIVETPRGRYRLAQPGDVIVLGRWRCAVALPALLRPGSGQVWVWDTWAAGPAPLAGRLVTQVPAAQALAVSPGPRGCDRIRVARRRGPPVVIQPDDPA